MEETEIRTSRFSLRPAVVARHAMLHRAGKFWLIVGTPILAAIICGVIYDERILFIAAAIVFVLFPTLRLLGYNDIMTRPWAVNSIYPHEVTLTAANVISIQYWPLPRLEEPSEEEEPDGRTTEEEEPEEVEPEAVRVPEPLKISSELVLGCYYWSKYLVIDYRPSKHPHEIGSRELLIPLTVFPTVDSSLQFIRRLSRHKH